MGAPTSSRGGAAPLEGGTRRWFVGGRCRRSGPGGRSGRCGLGRWKDDAQDVCPAEVLL